MLKDVLKHGCFIFCVRKSVDDVFEDNTMWINNVCSFTGKDRDANKLSLRVVALSVAGLVQETRQKAWQGHQGEHNRLKSLFVTYYAQLNHIIYYYKQVNTRIEKKNITFFSFFMNLLLYVFDFELKIYTNYISQILWVIR